MYHSIVQISYQLHGSGITGGVVAHGISNEEVTELKKEIENLKTQISAYEAGYYCSYM